MELKQPITEAEKYIQKAKDILSNKAQKEGDFYVHKKYVKMAGNKAWEGVLIALDATLRLSEPKKKSQRLEFDDYKVAVARIDKKVPTILQITYDLLHKSMGYDGIQDYTTVQRGLYNAENILMWCEKHYKN